MALAACLVIMILSSAGTLFWARRYDAPLTSKGEADRSMGVPGLEGEQFLGWLKCLQALKVAIQRSGESGAEWSGKLFTDAATAGIERSS